MLPELETEILLVIDVLIPTDTPVVVNATPRLTSSEPLIAPSEIEASAPPLIVPVPFVELSLPAIINTSAVTGIARVKHSKTEDPTRRLFFLLNCPRPTVETINLLINLIFLCLIAEIPMLNISKNLLQ